MAKLVDIFYAWCIKKRELIIRAFYFLYALLFFILVYGGKSVYYLDAKYSFFYSLALILWKIAVINFSVVLIPGIFKRFRLRHKTVSLLMIFRRYIGISMFLFALIHASFIRLIPVISRMEFVFLRPAFELAGLSALFLLFLLFTTSNYLSQRILKIWWYRLHKLIYLIMWLILFHLGLQRISIWTLISAITVFVMIASFIYQYLSRIRR